MSITDLEENPFRPEELEPTFLASAEPSTEPATAAPVIVGPQFLSDVWDMEIEQTRPDFLAVEGGDPLLFTGLSHYVYGSSNSGKSMFFQFTIREVVSALDTGVVLIVDYESDLKTTVERLRAFGVSKEQAGRIAYWPVSGSLLPGQVLGDVFAAWCTKWLPALVVVDSVSVTLAASGISENDNEGYVAWDTKVVKPLTRQGITSLLIDHIGHVGEERRGRLPLPRGATGKRDQVSGAAYYFEAVEPWSRKSTSGKAKLTTAKCRPGFRKIGEVAAEVSVSIADEGGTLDMFLSLPVAARKSSGSVEPRRTWYMEQISRYLEEAGQQSGNKIDARIKELGKSVVYRTGALKMLVDEGFVSPPVDGPRNSKLYTSLRPYRQVSDPLFVVEDTPF